MDRSPGPWYKEPWPWLLMIAPAASVVMGGIFWVLAVRTEDGLVADDYYQQGLAVNQVLDREARAATLDLRGVLSFNPERTRARLALQPVPPPSSPVTLRLVHPTRAGEDQLIRLIASSSGTLEGKMRPPASGRWHVVLEDEAGTWRLAGTWYTEKAVVELAARAAAPGG